MYIATDSNVSIVWYDRVSAGLKAAAIDTFAVHFPHQACSFHLSTYASSSHVVCEDETRCGLNPDGVTVWARLEPINTTTAIMHAPRGLFPTTTGGPQTIPESAVSDAFRGELPLSCASAERLDASYLRRPALLC